MSKDHSVEMDALAAHLDRGWDLLHHGDVAGARLSAAHILRLNPDSPEGHTLLGAIHVAQGEPQEGLEYLQQAMELDPEYLDAVLYAAELLIHTLGEVERGLRLCDEAEELALEPEDRLDLGLMRAEGYLLAGKLEQATAALDGVQRYPCREPGSALRAGRVNLDVGRPERAVELLTTLVEMEEYRADAHYFLGVAKEQLGAQVEALEHFLCAARLDREHPGPGWTLTMPELEQVVCDVLGGLPAEVRRTLQGLPLRLLGFPALELIAEGFDPRGLVFVSTVVHAAGQQREGADSDCRPSGLFVYKANLERVTPTRADVASTLQQALLQELEALFHPGPVDCSPVGRVGGADN